MQKQKSQGSAASALAAGSSAVSVLDKPAQSTERIVPLFRNQFEIVAYLMKPWLIQLPDVLAAMTGTANETRSLHHAQMLAHGLARHLKAPAEPGDRGGALVA